MKWKTRIDPKALFPLVIGFTITLMIGSIIDKNYAKLPLKILAFVFLAFVLLYFMTKTIRITTTDQGIGYWTLWKNRSLDWEDVGRCERGMGMIKLVSKDEIKSIDIPIGWLKEKDAFLQLLESKLPGNDGPEPITCMEC